MGNKKALVTRYVRFISRCIEVPHVNVTILKDQLCCSISFISVSCLQS